MRITYGEEPLLNGHSAASTTSLPKLADDDARAQSRRQIVPQIRDVDASPSLEEIVEDTPSIDYLYPARFRPKPAFPSSHDFEVKRFDETVGMGVMSFKGFKPGDLVAVMTGELSTDVLQHTLQIREGLHLHDPWFSGYFLHSCDPNIHLDMEKLEVRCVREIKPNDWLFMDYAQTEDELFACFPCSCGATSCRKVITGRKQAGADVASSMLWWRRADLYYEDSQLQFAGKEVNALAEQHGTPSFFYNGRRVVENAQRIRDALDAAGLEGRHSLLYAMKANRFAPLLTFLKCSGAVTGLDVCSPNEVEAAMGCGWSAKELSFTSTSLSRKDMARLTAIKGLNINLDSISALRRWGELGRDRDVGIRINPAAGVSREDNDLLQYAGPKTTKFGIYKEQLAEALEVAAEFGLRITRIHFHTGCGFLTPQLPQYDAILQECLWFVDQVATCREVNLGGGLGVPYTAEDEALDLTQWSAVIERQFRNRDLSILLEPGAYIAHDAGLLLVTANAIEKKASKTFVGVDAGFNIALEPSMYALPFQPVPAEWKADSPKHLVSIAGNINEALDVWFEDIELPQVEEDDVFALLNAGAYSSSMASNHCLRGDFTEFLLL